MPRLTHDAWYVPYQPLEEFVQEPTPAQYAGSTTSQPSPVVAVPAGLQEMNVRWSGVDGYVIEYDGPTQPTLIPPPLFVRTDLMAANEEKMKNIIKDWNHPRKSGRLAVPVDPAFVDDLPVVDSDKYWAQIPYGTRSMTMNYFDYATPLTIMMNTESTVFFESALGLSGYICSCEQCKAMVITDDMAINGRARSSQAREIQSILQQDPNYIRNSLMSMKVDKSRFYPRFEKRYIGHLGRLVALEDEVRISDISNYLNRNASAEVIDYRDAVDSMVNARKRRPTPDDGPSAPQDYYYNSLLRFREDRSRPF